MQKNKTKQKQTNNYEHLYRRRPQKPHTFMHLCWVVTFAICICIDLMSLFYFLVFNLIVGPYHIIKFVYDFQMLAQMLFKNLDNYKQNLDFNKVLVETLLDNCQFY